MAFVELNGIEDVNEPQVQDDGEYVLVVEDAAPHTSETSKKTSIRVILGFADIPDAANIFHYLPLAADDDDENKRKMKMLMTRRFLEHFQVPYDNGLNTEDLLGCSALTKVTKDLRDEADPDSGFSNSIKLPSLK